MENISDQTGYKELLTSSSRRASIAAQSSDGTSKQPQELLESVRDFCLHIATSAEDSFYLDKLTYLVKLYRKVRIADTDDKEYFQHHDFNGDKFEFILATNDKLIYPRDIKSALRVPFYFSSIISDKELKSDAPVYIEKYDEHNAVVRPLTREDTVVDTHLNLIWPIKTGQIPVRLKKLLKQTTEKVR